MLFAAVLPVSEVYRHLPWTELISLIVPQRKKSPPLTISPARLSFSLTKVPGLAATSAPTTKTLWYFRTADATWSRLVGRTASPDRARKKK